MKTVLAKALAAVGAAALVVSTTACSAPLPGGTGRCDFTVNYPHGSTSKSGYIDGKGKVTCTYSSGTLTDLKIETRLQKWNGKSWATVANTTRATSHKTVKSGVTYTGVSNFIVCQTGIFRTQSRGSGSLNGVKNASAEWQTTNTRKGVKNPCVKPLQIVSVG